MIEVTHLGGEDPLEFAVKVRAGKGETQHRVTLSADTLETLAKGTAPADFIRAAFEFLLEREPKEAILARFDVTLIGRYFPEFAEEIGNYLGR